jgi:hypothetical protein
MNIVYESTVDRRREWLTESQLRLLKLLIDHPNGKLTANELARTTEIDNVPWNVYRLALWLGLPANDGVPVGTIEETQQTRYRFRPGRDIQNCQRCCRGYRAIDLGSYPSTPPLWKASEVSRWIREIGVIS